MAKTTHRDILFDNHAQDLKSILPGIQDIFVCPICFQHFFRESIENNLVDIGHVWPNYFREKSEKAKHQQVLLCKKCNSSAGSSGDEIMQAFAKIHEGQKRGELGLRKIRVTKSKNPWEGIELEAYILEKGGNNFRLAFPGYSKPSQRKHYEEQRKKFQQFSDTDPVTITIYPPRGKPGNPFGNPTNTLLTQAGFLTSAYLLAFFEYGYRYIMQTSLDPVREYILQSFEKKVDERLNFDNSKNLCFQICSDPSHYCVDPEIYLVIPADENVPFYQETRFLDFHVRLPVPSFFPGVSRHDLITEFVALGEQSLGEYEKGFSINIGRTFVSNLDHPRLIELQNLFI